MIGIFGLILLIGFLPDAFFRHLLIPNNFLAINLALDALELITAMWICGAYGAMSQRPHELDGRNLQVRFGAFASLMLPLESITDAQAVPESENRRRLKRRERHAAFFAIPGTGLVRIELGAPREITSYPYLTRRRVTALYVPSDRPAEFAALVKGRIASSG